MVEHPAQGERYRFGSCSVGQSKEKVVMDLANEINSKCTYLNTQIEQLSKTGREYAEAYTKYRIALAKELMRLKDEGFAITLAGDIARGKPDIARLKFDEIAKEAVYKANLESINAIKLQIKILDAQLEREWVHND